MTRRQALAAVAGGLVAASAAEARDQPLTPHQAGEQLDGAEGTIRFEVRPDFSTGDEGEVLLHDYLSSDHWTGATRVGFRVVLTGKARREFRRVGVADLGTHFRGRLVTARGKVTSAFYTGPGIHRGTLTIDSLEQFVAVQ